MNNLFSKLRDFVTGTPGDEYDEYYDGDAEGQGYQNLYPEQPPAPAAPADNSQTRSRLRDRTASAVGMSSSNIGMGGADTGMNTNLKGMSNVIGMPGAANGITEVVVMEPRSFEEMPQAIQGLRERKSVVLNLTMMDPDQAQRAVDFIAGGTYALDGHQERIGESIFLFTPNCVQVSTQSGVVHDVLQHHIRSSRQPMAPTGNWNDDQMRMASQ